MRSSCGGRGGAGSARRRRRASSGGESGGGGNGGSTSGCSGGAQQSEGGLFAARGGLRGCAGARCGARNSPPGPSLVCLPAEAGRLLRDSGVAAAAAAAGGPDLDVEDELRVGRDDRGEPPGPVAVVGADAQLRLLGGPAPAPPPAHRRHRHPRERRATPHGRQCRTRARERASARAGKRACGHKHSISHARTLVPQSKLNP